MFQPNGCESTSFDTLYAVVGQVNGSQVCRRIFECQCINENYMVSGEVHSFNFGQIVESLSKNSADSVV